MRRPRRVVLSVLPLVLLFNVVSCDGTDQPDATLVEATVVSALADRSDACVDRAAEILELTRVYSGDIRGVRQDCPGDNCVPQARVTDATFRSVATAHAGLLFACTPATAETCDGVDNDEDGSSDDGFDK